MIRQVKTFEREDHILIVDTTSGERVVTRIPKGGAIPKPQPPGKFRKARNFAKAAVKHAKAGAPRATDEQVAERFAICQACELFKPIGDGSQQGTCTHPTCGCKLKSVGLTGRNKLRWAEQECPIGRWLPDYSPSREDSGSDSSAAGSSDAK